MSPTLLVVLLLGAGSVAAHPCEDEVASACPDRPGAEMAKCLKTASEHDAETELSSDCTDFIALNVACKEDITNFCDDAFFSDDTTLCLTQWTDQERISGKCGNVMKWAIPKDEEEEGEADTGPTDELGLSEKDYAEKKEWQAKRKEGRKYSVDAIQNKERDRKIEEDRVELERFKKEEPEAYAEMIRQQEEEKKQQAEFKRRERKQAAALERKKREAAGLSEDDEKPSAGTKKAKGKKAKGGSWMSAIFAFLLVAGACYGAYMVLNGAGKSGGGGKSSKQQGKKKR